MHFLCVLSIFPTPGHLAQWISTSFPAMAPAALTQDMATLQHTPTEESPHWPLLKLPLRPPDRPSHLLPQE